VSVSVSGVEMRAAGPQELEAGRRLIGA
jgi:hypothetical protein